MTNYRAVQEKVSHICLEKGKQLVPQIIGVSKKQSIEKMKSSYNEGLRDFGENYVQEFLEKFELFKEPNIRWHFIGGLQTNKVRFIVGKVEYIHSVDRLKLAKEIHHRSQDANLVQKILLQVDFSNSDTRSGTTDDELEELIEECLKLQNLKLCGLMTVPPITESIADSEKFFEKLASLKNQFQNKFVNQLGDFNELSMGMSADFPWAIAQGSTMLRIGSSIFGERK